MEIIIRRSKLQDKEYIKSLNIEMFEHDAQNDSDLDMDWVNSEQADSFYTKLATGNNKICFVAEYAGEVIGFIGMFEKHTSYRKSTYWEIEVIGVTKKMRGQNVGSQLIQAAEQYAKEQGADKMILEMFSRNHSAEGFYQKHGYGEISKQLEKVL